MKKILPLFVVISVCLWSCTDPEWKDPSSHNITFITVDSAVRLEVLDWGGKGEPLLFLAGLGNTGHVFDDFAPQFTDQFHVLALTRRGFGSSSKPATGYDPASLAKDILGIIDSLGIERITLDVGDA
jgi:pimeloyl-ACP methyl ester carboxylesterase